LKRGVFAKHEIKEGEQIAGEDVFFAMPCEETQLSSGEFGRYRAKYAASCTYKQGEPIFERSEIDEVSLARDYVHEAKGMLREAHIEVGTDVEIEVSHHEGIENFRRVGCVLINVVNRKYCKKLVIVFPGQQHPSHAHKLKEETFQLLWGDLEVVMDGAQKNLQPGDIMLVEPQQLHSFRSRHGAIFEEVSTTHERKDSFYEDDRITQMDTLERKTIIQDW
jgi:N-acetylneuraminate synthase